MAPICSMERTVRNLQKRTRLSSEEEKKEFFGYLNNKLSELGLEGTVQTLLVFDAHGKINCYGKRIDPEIIFNKLNLSIGEHGSKIADRISYPEPHRVDSYQKGHFVPGKNFYQDQTYVALVNIPLNLEDTLIEAYQYPKRN